MKKLMISLYCAAMVAVFLLYSMEQGHAGPGHLVKIPMAVQATDLFSRGRVVDDHLMLNLDEIEPIGLTSSFAQIYDEKKGLPLLIAVVRVKDKGKTSYYVYEASSFNRWLLNDNLESRRVETDPSTNSPIDGPVYYYHLSNISPDFEFLGTDQDLFSGPTSKQKFMRAVFEADKDDADPLALRFLAFAHQQAQTAESDELADLYLKKAVERGSIDALVDLAYFNASRERYDIAQDYLMRAVQRGNAYAWVILARLQEDLLQLNKAEESYKQAIQSGHRQALVDLGVLYMRQKKYDQAKEQFVQAISELDQEGREAAREQLDELKQLERKQ